MTASPPRPRCIVSLLGNSVALLVVPERESRVQGNYAEWLERMLAERGIAPDVRNHARWLEVVTGVARAYEDLVRSVAPDVLILHYGINEAVPAAIPTWLVRLNHDWRSDAGLGLRRIRRELSAHLWHFLRRYQRFAARRLETRTWRVSPARLRSELGRVIREARSESSCLVLVVDMLPPRGHTLDMIPHLDTRVEMMQTTLETLVASQEDEDVRLVRASDVVARIGAEDAVPDGVHLSAEAHRQVAELICAEIESWLARHPEIQFLSTPGRA